MNFDSRINSDIYGKYNLYKKLHDTRFNYHLITSILKSQNSVAQRNNFPVVQMSY